MITIKSRTASDLRQSTDLESTDNKFIGAKIGSLPEDKQKQLEAIVVKSINDYANQTHFEPGVFFMVFQTLGRTDPKEIAEVIDIRVRSLGGDRYVAEYWEDALELNSESHAVTWAAELAKRNPDDKNILKEVKENYANNRKSIEAGKQERYSKVMALLYVQEENGSFTYREPFQTVIDFIRQQGQ